MDVYYQTVSVKSCLSYGILELCIHNALCHSVLSRKCGLGKVGRTFFYNNRLYFDDKIRKCKVESVKCKGIVA